MSEVRPTDIRDPSSDIFESICSLLDTAPTELTPQMGLFQQPEGEIGWRSGRQDVHGASPEASANPRDPKNTSRPSVAGLTHWHVGKQ